MDPSAPAFSSSSSTPTVPRAPSTAAQTMLSLLPHQKSEMNIEDEFFFLLQHGYMELVRQHLELGRTAVAFMDLMAEEAQAIHAQEILIANRPRRKRKRKVGAASASLPRLPMNNSVVIEEAPSADDAPSAKQCRVVDED